MKKKSNLKKNWYFPVLEAAFLLFIRPADDLGFYLSFVVAVCLGITFAEKSAPVIDSILKQTLTERLLAIFGAAGIVLAYTPTISENIGQAILMIVLMMLSSIFLFVCLSCFWRYLVEQVVEYKIFTDITQKEIILYGVLIFTTIAYAGICFFHSNAFYGSNIKFDTIYTSDSSFLVRENAYLNLFHQENDIRQPLFAVFAAPFIGVPNFFAAIFNLSPTMSAILINSVQIVLMFASNFLIAKAMGLTGGKRIVFMTLLTCTYTHLLFSIMMEQYIIAYFYLALCVFVYSQKRNITNFALYGAGGTLLTSLAFLPFAAGISPIKQPKAWFKHTCKTGIGFIGQLFAFCRFKLVLTAIPMLQDLSYFSGKTVSITDKFYQYTTFMTTCLVGPEATEKIITVNNLTFPSWQALIPAAINWFGIVILVLVIISAVIHRTDMSVNLAAYWVVISAVILLGFGWGTRENGLILYSLYFGWALFALLFKLMECLEEKLKVKNFCFFGSLAASAALLALNIPKIYAMLEFAAKTYPA